MKENLGVVSVTVEYRDESSRPEASWISMGIIQILKDIYRFTGAVQREIAHKPELLASGVAFHAIAEVIDGTAQRLDREKEVKQAIAVSPKVTDNITEGQLLQYSQQTTNGFTLNVTGTANGKNIKHGQY